MSSRIIFLLLTITTSTLVLAEAPPLTWSELNDQQQKVLQPFSNKWDSIPAERQQRILKGVKRWSELNEGERAHFKKRFKQWRSLPKEKRDKVRKRFKRYLALSPDQRQAVRNTYRRFRQLPKAKQQKLKQRWNNASPAQRRRFIEQRRNRPIR